MHAFPNRKWNLFFWLLIIIVVIRVLLIDSLRIDSQANEPELKTGDLILISKIHYGARLPFTTKRLSGLSHIKRGDLIAFNFPEGDSVVKGMESISYYAMKRKAEIENGAKPIGKVSYRPVYRRSPEVSRCLGIPGDTIMNNPGGMSPDQGDYNIFPHDARYPWNRDNFGPVIVPKKGDCIRLTLLNLCIYQRIIEVYERNRIEIRSGQIFISGSPVDTYTFKQDYYFVTGDNRLQSRDSRHWGFLPGDHIIGKPVIIWFSKSWNRIFNILP